MRSHIHQLPDCLHWRHTDCHQVNLALAVLFHFLMLLSMIPFCTVARLQMVTAFTLLGTSQYIPLQLHSLPDASSGDVLRIMIMSHRHCARQHRVLSVPKHSHYSRGRFRRVRWLFLHCKLFYKRTLSRTDRYNQMYYMILGLALQ